MPVSLLSEIDTWAEGVESELGGIRVGRAGAMRSLLMRGLQNNRGAETSSDIGVVPADIGATKGNKGPQG